MFKRLFTAALLFGVAATAPPALAQTVTCALRETVVARLSDTFAEQLVAGGLQNSQTVVEVWTAPGTGTFTVLLSDARGISCVIASGTEFHQKLPEIINTDPAG